MVALPGAPCSAFVARSRIFAAALWLATPVLCWYAPAVAADYPTKPITIVVPFTAGGPTDALARALGERMRANLGQPLVIENVTGAGGSIGVGRVARAAPDGYTVSIGHVGTHVANGALYPLPYDLLNDLEPVAMLPSNPMLIVTKKDVPASDLGELLAWVMANPDRVATGTAGVGSGAHISGLLFENLTGARLRFVPYRGSAPALQDLVAGQIDMIIDQASNSLPQVRNGNIKPFAVTANKRLASAPDIPSVDEAGLPGFHVEVWSGLWVPKGTPREIVDKLNAAAVEALADAATRKRFEALGLEVPPREQQTPEALGMHQKAEVEKWWPLLKAANVKVE
jgi:tripartite-type tricarboxylate transporter receptor subunit TctC